MPLAKSYKDLNVYRNAMEAAFEIFTITKGFPSEEKYSMTDQIRRSSRSVCANLAEAWRKRRYKAAFIAKLSDAESEAAETQSWIAIADKCGYLSESFVVSMNDRYDHIMSQITLMIDTVDSWLIS